MPDPVADAFAGKGSGPPVYRPLQRHGADSNQADNNSDAASATSSASRNSVFTVMRVRGNEPDAEPVNRGNDEVSHLVAYNTSIDVIPRDSNNMRTVQPLHDVAMYQRYLRAALVIQEYVRQPNMGTMLRRRRAAEQRRKAEMAERFRAEVREARELEHAASDFVGPTTGAADNVIEKKISAAGAYTSVRKNDRLYAEVGKRYDWEKYYQVLEDEVIANDWMYSDFEGYQMLSGGDGQSEKYFKLRYYDRRLKGRRDKQGNMREAGSQIDFVIPLKQDASRRMFDAMKSDMMKVMLLLEVILAYTLPRAQLDRVDKRDAANPSHTVPWLLQLQVPYMTPASSSNTTGTTKKSSILVQIGVTNENTPNNECRLFFRGSNAVLCDFVTWITPIVMNRIFGIPCHSENILGCPPELSAFIDYGAKPWTGNRYCHQVLPDPLVQCARYPSSQPLIHHPVIFEVLKTLRMYDEPDPAQWTRYQVLCAPQANPAAVRKRMKAVRAVYPDIGWMEEPEDIPVIMEDRNDGKGPQPVMAYVEGSKPPRYAPVPVVGRQWGPHLPTKVNNIMFATEDVIHETNQDSWGINATFSQERTTLRFDNEFVDDPVIPANAVWDAWTPRRGWDQWATAGTVIKLTVRELDWMRMESDLTIPFGRNHRGHQGVLRQENAGESVLMVCEGAGIYYDRHLNRNVMSSRFTQASFPDMRPTCKKNHDGPLQSCNCLKCSLDSVPYQELYVEMMKDKPLFDLDVLFGEEDGAFRVRAQPRGKGRTARHEDFGNTPAPSVIGSTIDGSQRTAKTTSSKSGGFRGTHVGNGHYLHKNKRRKETMPRNVDKYGRRKRSKAWTWSSSTGGRQQGPASTKTVINSVIEKLGAFHGKRVRSQKGSGKGHQLPDWTQLKNEVEAFHLGRTGEHKQFVAPSDLNTVFDSHPRQKISMAQQLSYIDPSRRREIGDGTRNASEKPYLMHVQQMHPESYADFPHIQRLSFDQSRRSIGKPLAGVCIPYNSATKGMCNANLKCGWLLDDATGRVMATRCLLKHWCTYCNCPERKADPSGWICMATPGNNPHGCCERRRECPGANRGHIVRY